MDVLLDGLGPPMVAAGRGPRGGSDGPGPAGPVDRERRPAARGPGLPPSRRPEEVLQERRSVGLDEAVETRVLDADREHPSDLDRGGVAEVPAVEVGAGERLPHAGA